ncbi:RCC1 domain-containing protein [Microbacterium enclense]|uniref:RCC1 domain-containing protein n=1 Tax=Microbacterium enclense TaxID=993073 RepID=UPI0034244751
MTDLEPLADAARVDRGISRRAVVGASLWSVPAIVAVTSTPAFAASNSRYELSVLPPASVLAAGATPVSGILTTTAGQPVPGSAMTLTLGTVSSTGTTDGTGTCTKSMDLQRRWATPGSSVSITALANSLSDSAFSSVVGANLLIGADNWFGQLGTGQSGPQVPTLTQTSLMFPSPVVDVSASGAHTLALLADGTVWSVGLNNCGQLGDGTFANRTTWAVVPGVSNVISVTTTIEGSIALTASGDVWAWGGGTNAQLGQDDASKWGSNWPTPQKVKSLPGAKKLSSTAARVVFVLMSDGTVKSWGEAFQFQRGDADGSSRGTAATIAGLTDVVQVASGFGTSGLALKSDGTVWAWGGNDVGQLCDGTTNARATPAPIPGLSDVKQISGGLGAAFRKGTGFALKNDRTVWAWGDNAYGQIGDGSTTNRSAPVQVSGISNATQITGSIASAYALLADGRLAAWGSTRLDPVWDTTTPGFVATGRPVVELRASQHNTQRFNGLFLITGSTTLSVSPANQTVTAGTAASITVRESTAAGSAAAGIDVQLVATRDAVLGASTGTTDAQGEFTTTVTPDAWTMPGDSVRVTVADEASESTADLKVTGANLLVSGSNYFGILGVGTNNNSEWKPRQTSPVFPSPVVELDSSGAWAIALLKDGTVWTTGGNFTGALGDGTFTDRYVWGIVPGLTDIIDVTTTLEGCIALTRSGDVYAWGGGLEGQLGQADSSKWSSNWPTPMKIDGISGVVKIASSVSRVGYALTGDGQAWAWGTGGRLGDGTDVTRGTPQPIPGMSNVVQMASGMDGGLMLKGDGTVWAWGSNQNGQLCDGTTNFSNTPLQITGLSDVKQLSGCNGDDWLSYNGMALKNDGTVWTWGSNLAGQLGDGTTNDRHYPGQVLNLSGVQEIAGSIGAAYALLNDGRVAAWGKTGIDGIGYRRTPGFFTPSRHVTKIRASLHNWHTFRALYMITE